MIQIPIQTPEGTFLAWFSECGLRRLEFPASRRLGRVAGLSQLARPEFRQARRWGRLTAQALGAILAGKPPPVLPPLDLSAGTPFQRSVWGALSGIPWGQTRSYGAIATALRNPRAVRAVGGACGANPIPVLVPCHRVLPQAGGWGGFSGGLKWKQRLLKGEGFVKP